MTQSGHCSLYLAGQTFVFFRKDPCLSDAMAAERKDVWASGDAYEPYVGRWSRLVARQFVAWLGMPPNKDWLDVGSGTGALCEVILAGVSPRQVTGVDPSDGFVSFARHKITDKRATLSLNPISSIANP